MRWLEKIYAKVLKSFRSELKTSAGLKDSEIEMCIKLATQDILQGDIKQHIKIA
jgi:hypothetical protein